MYKIIISVLVFMFFGFLILLIGNMVYCSRGCASGYKNYVEIHEFEHEQEKETQYVIYRKTAGEDGPTVTEISSVLFECKIKVDGKKEKFTFRIDTLDENGNPTVLREDDQLRVIVREEDINKYKTQNEIYGSIISYEIIDVAFTSYYLESDNFPAWRFYFVPTH